MIYFLQMGRSNKKIDPKTLFDDVPFAQIIDIPKQLAWLSKDRSQFGDIPVGVLLRDILTIRNTSERSVSFRWDTGDEMEVDKVVTIIPSNGLLKPNECCTCRMEFRPSFQPRIYQTDIRCDIMDEDEAVDLTKEGPELIYFRLHIKRNLPWWKRLAVNITWLRWICLALRILVDPLVVEA